jgi:tol-pal system-associated acyl-CoA thioesterase
VYYEDTDSLGVVYYANYLKYFERGRSECIEALGGHVGTWNARGYNFVVYKIAVTYHHAARLGDQCEVETTVLKGKSAYRLKMDQRLYRGSELLTSATVELLCLDKEFELREFPAELLATAVDA